MKALVLDGHLKSALTIVRSLGEAGVTLSVGATRTTAMALHSKYTCHAFTYPSPYTNQEDFVHAVRAEAARLGDRPVVYACSDATFLSLYTYRDSLKDVLTIAYPSEKSMDVAFNKAATYSLARVSGVPTITTYAPETREELRLVAQAIQYPAVVKTRRSVTWLDDVGVFGSATFVDNAQSLEDTFFALKNKVGEPPLVQVFVQGEEYGVECLARDGEVYAQVVHHRIRSLSPTGGASVLKETVPSGNLKHVLISHAQTLIEKLSWTGPIMVEFKVDADTLKPYLMEINGRFWGSLPLSVLSGVNMPFLYFDALMHNTIPNPKIEGRDGVTSRHFLGDVLNITRVFFARDSMRKILYPKRLKALYDFFFLRRGTRSDVWQFRDMKPVLMEVIDVFAKSHK